MYILDCDLECAICLQSCIHPAELPCGHIFCFLCVKGIALQSRKCALCRQSIPRDYLEHPTLVQWSAVLKKLKAVEDNYQWFYEGRNGRFTFQHYLLFIEILKIQGWWQYDERSNGDIEQAYKLNQRLHEILICGQLYVVDFENKCQFLKTNPNRKRCIKREKVKDIEVKGIAGLANYMK